MSSNTPKTLERYADFVSAVEKRKTFLDEGRFSLPSAEGIVAIWFSGASKKELALLGAHAGVLEGRYAVTQVTMVDEQPSLGRISEIIADPDVSSIIVLGHGSLNAMRIYGHSLNRYDYLAWYDIASQMTHLKTGFFEQRTCANVSDSHKAVRLPLGTFLMVDQSSISAPLGHKLPNSAGVAEFDMRMQPIYAQPSNTAEQLREPLL